MLKIVAIEIKYEVEVKMLLYYLFFAVVDTAAYLSNKYPTWARNFCDMYLLKVKPYW